MFACLYLISLLRCFSFQLLNKVVPAARMVERAFWEASAPVRSTSPVGAANTTNASGNEITSRFELLQHHCNRTRFLNVCFFTFTGIVVLFHMENGFRKDVHTADVDMDFCTASHMFSAKTVVSL